MNTGLSVGIARRIALSAAAGLLFAVAASAEVVPALIGIDDRNGYSPDRYLASADRFEMFRAEIEALGSTLVPLTTFEAADLVGLDALILAMPDSFNPASLDYSPSEIAAIQAFVAAGGGLLAHGEAGGSSDLSVANLNSLLSPYGVVFAATGKASTGEAVPPEAYAVSHPVLGGIALVIGLDFYRPIDSAAAPAIDLFEPAWSGSRFIAVANMVGGGGNVAALGDTSLWTDPGEGDNVDLLMYDSWGPPVPNDNLVLLHNVIRFITALIGDIDVDGDVDLTDLGILLINFGATGVTLTDGDVDGDGDVDLTDLGTMLIHFGESR